MINPEDAFRMEFLEQARLNLCFRERLVAVRRQQTTRSGEDRAPAVALEGPPLQYEVETTDLVASEGLRVVEPTIESVVEIGRELLTPAIETEVEQAAVTLVVDEGDETMIACPRVVGR